MKKKNKQFCCVVQADLKFTLFCLSLPSAGIIGMHYHTHTVKRVTVTKDTVSEVSVHVYWAALLLGLWLGRINRTGAGVGKPPFREETREKVL